MSSDPRSTPALEVRNLSKHFCSVVAINGVSMSVRPGEVMC